MRYHLSRKAEEDIVALYIDGADMFGLAQAEKYHTQLEQCFELIAASPKIARERFEISPPVRVHPFGVHIIVYILDETGEPVILRVRHGREDWDTDPLTFR